jgi:hypothetical protein
MTTTPASRNPLPRTLSHGILAAALAVIPIVPAAAHDLPTSGFAYTGGGGAPIRADGHAPIGVMGDHMHKKGEWMLSYRYMHMDMDGNRIGTDDVSPDTIVTTVPNRFAPPATLRVVPLWMTMDMHMLGAMYAPTDNHVHLNLGLSLPTGSVTERGTILTPMGGTPTVRLPYAMQLGTGTFDLLPGLTYTGRSSNLSWGTQFRSEIRLENENDEGYAWGDLYGATGWVAYEWASWISTSFRLDAWTQDSISGIDPAIAGPVQTANPAFYGGEQVFAYFGANFAGQTGALRGHRLVPS